jgi:hypothetical protein
MSERARSAQERCVWIAEHGRQCDERGTVTIAGDGSFGNFIPRKPSHCPEHGQAAIDRMNARGGEYRVVEPKMEGQE